jgi:hypothetical protein
MNLTKNVGKQGHNSRTEQVVMSIIKLKIEQHEPH